MNLVLDFLEPLNKNEIVFGLHSFLTSWNTYFLKLCVRSGIELDKNRLVEVVRTVDSLAPGN